MLFDFANVLVFTALGLGFVGVNLLIGKLLRPSNPQERKLSTYECGEPASGSAWVNFNIRFYLVALIFIIFEVEIAFIFPGGGGVPALDREWTGALCVCRDSCFRWHPVSWLDLRLGQGRFGVGEESQGLIRLSVRSLHEAIT
jgi:NADH-ubiquinone/plastoquinone oxidoreductase, chain 3